MTVEAQTPRKAYTYSGTGTPYPVTFTFIDDADLGVIHTSSAGVNTTLTLTSQYTVAGGAGSTGTITVLDATLDTATGSKLTIYSALGIEQQTDLVDGAAFLPSVLELQFDRNVRVMQQMQEELDRAVKVGVTSGTRPDALLAAIDQAVIDAESAESGAAASASTASSAATASQTAQGLAEAAEAGAVAARDAIPAAADILATGDIGVTVEAYDPGILKADTTNTLTVGFTETPLAYTSGDIAVSAGSLRTVDTAKNLIKSSEDFRTSSEGNPVSAWVASNCTVTINAIAAPDGSLTADKLVEDSATTVKARSQIVSVPDNSVVTFSIYAKAAENTQFELYGINGTNYVVARYNLSTVTSTLVSFSGTGVFLGSSIVGVGSGWYRCSLTYSLGAGITAYNNVVRFFDGTTPNYLGNGVNGFYVWGAQAEIGTLTDYQKAGATPETVLGMITGVGRVTLLLTGGGAVAYDAGYDFVIGAYDATKTGCAVQAVNDGTNQWLFFANSAGLPGWVDGGSPVGTVAHYAGATPPTGWLVRDGSAISRTTYSSLFAVIGTTYGSGDGSTTFNLPDDRNLFDRGVPVGGTVGTYQADTLKSHAHSLPLYTYNSHGLNHHCLSTAYQLSSQLGTYATGDTETRPKNRHYLPIIKY